MSKKIAISFVNSIRLDYNVIGNDHEFSHAYYCEISKSEQPNKVDDNLCLRKTSELVDGKILELDVSSNRC